MKFILIIVSLYLSITNHMCACSDNSYSIIIQNLIQSNLNNDAFISEYTIDSKNDKLHATIGRSNNRQFITKVVNKVDNETIIQIWSPDGKRIFTSTAGKNYCIEDAYLLIDALSSLESIFSDKEIKYNIENYLFLEKNNLCSGFWGVNHSTKLFDLIKADQNTVMQIIEGGKISLSNNHIGSIVVDAKNGSVYEQKNQMRTMIRIRHNVSSAKEEINEIVTKIKIDSFDKMPLSMASPWFTTASGAICQRIIDDIDRDEATYEGFKKNLESRHDKLLHEVIPLILKEKNHIFSNKKVDMMRDLYFEKIENTLKSHSSNQKKIESVMKSEKVYNAVATSMLDKFNEMNARASEKSKDMVLLDIYGCVLQANTLSGKKAKRDISDAFLSNYVKHVVQTSINRKKRNQDLE